MAIGSGLEAGQHSKGRWCINLSKTPFLSKTVQSQRVDLKQTLYQRLQASLVVHTWNLQPELENVASTKLPVICIPKINLSKSGIVAEVSSLNWGSRGKLTHFNKHYNIKLAEICEGVKADWNSKGRFVELYLFLKLSSVNRTNVIPTEAREMVCASLLFCLRAVLVTRAEWGTTL